MNRRSFFIRAVILSCLLVFLVFMQTGTAQAVNNKDDASNRNEMERAQRAANVMSEIMKAPDNGIPRDLLEKATAIAVIPRMIKGAFVVGGDHGKGLVSQRMRNGSWSTPLFIELSGGSYGLQFGVSSTDYVLVFTNREGIEPLLRGKLRLGADAAVAAGPVGRNLGAHTGILMESKIFTYSRSRGAFVGVALNGAYLSIDDGANRDAYGREISARDVLEARNVRPNPVVMPFLRALDRYGAGAGH
jgi:lipid-binding SYLF domain-containing protein